MILQYWGKLLSFTAQYCQAPTSIEHGVFRILHQVPVNDEPTAEMVPENTVVIYNCYEGYKLSAEHSSVLICSGGTLEIEMYLTANAIGIRSCVLTLAVLPMDHLKSMIDRVGALTTEVCLMVPWCVTHACSGTEYRGRDTRKCEGGLWSDRQPSCVSNYGLFGSSGHWAW